MNVCGILIHASPGRMAEVREAIAQAAGAEVHAATDDGRLIVTVDDQENVVAGETLLALHRHPGVLSAAIVYHHFEAED
jgi:nitrate reductase NapD